MKLHYEPPGTPDDEHIDYQSLVDFDTDVGLSIEDYKLCRNLESGRETILSDGARVLRYDGTTMDPDSETYYRKGEREAG